MERALTTGNGEVAINKYFATFLESLALSFGGSDPSAKSGWSALVILARLDRQNDAMRSFAER
jgi:hypothetical protein